MNICVYGASSAEIDKKYITAAEKFGEEMAERGHSLIFGGGATGLMGAVVHGLDRKGGYSLGVAPTFFDMPGVLYENCSEFIFTETMRQRKEIMENRADAFVMTPGGIGTFEEFFEILTLKQLGQHNKPIAILNTGGYFDVLAKMLQNAVDQGFMKAECLALYGMFEDATELLNYIEI